MNAPPPRCRHCDAPLTLPQQRLGSTCGRSACLHREGQARWARLAATVGRAALQDAAATVREQPVALLWLRDSETRLVPLPAERRAAHHAHLQQLLEPPPDGEVQPLAPAEPAAAALGAQEGRLCAQCVGRCCTPGGTHHAFLSRPQLLRWQQARPGRTLQDAADWFMAQLPADHVRGGCSYHGAQGCVLPREERADVCNSYACDALLEVQQALRAGPAPAFVAVTLDGDAPVRRALLSDDRSTPLP